MAPKSPKENLLRPMAEHVLANGLNTASLRPLAKAAGTSDRMLVYHFGSKGGLMADLLQFLAQELAVKLDTALPQKRAETNGACMSEIISLIRTPPFRPYMKVWLDIVSAAGQGNAHHAAVGHAMMSGFLDWLEARLPETETDRPAMAALMLTLMEGVIVMDEVGHSALSDQAIKKLFENR